MLSGRIWAAAPDAGNVGVTKPYLIGEHGGAYWNCVRHSRSCQAFCAELYPYNTRAARRFDAMLDRKDST